MSPSSAVDVQDLRKVYRDGLFGRRRIEALGGVSLAVGHGEIFGLLGPNGAGKTTLIKILLGIVRASGGAASLLGLPAGSRAGRKQVGYLPENHRIPRHHTGNSALMFFGSLSGLSRAEVRRRRGPLLAAVGLAEWGNTSVKKYSKGMLQRLGLAQAMLHDPQLLILDEPTDGVDPVGRSEMRTLLQAAQGRRQDDLHQQPPAAGSGAGLRSRGDSGSRQGAAPGADLGADRSGPTPMCAWSSREARRAVRARWPACRWSRLARWERINSKCCSRPAGQAAIDAAIDRLRRHALSLVSMSRSRQTLEEAFLAILQRARGART